LEDLIRGSDQHAVFARKRHQLTEKILGFLAVQQVLLVLFREVSKQARVDHVDIPAFWGSSWVMSRLALDEALKKPGRIMTWHAGANSRSHKSSRRQDYITVLPRELVKLTYQVGSTTDVFEFLELFLDELLYEQLYGDDAPDATEVQPVLLTMQGYFAKFLEFYVKEAKPAGQGMNGVGTSWLDVKKRKDPRWLILANQNVRRLGDCYESFERLLDVAERVAKRHNLVMDLEQARDGFRTMLRRRAEATGQAPDLSLMDVAPLARHDPAEIWYV
jgi:hypothetical protein